MSDRRVLRTTQAVVLVGLVVVLQLGLAQPASACSCGSGLGPDGEIAERIVTHAEAIYVAQPRLHDLLPGRSFQVERTLRGPPRHNLRVDIRGELLSFLPGNENGGSRCEVSSVPMTRYLIVGDPSDLTISLCSEWAIGDEVVEAAIAQLGPGIEMGWRPDVLWLAQWVLLSAGVVFVVRGGWRRLRRRRARAVGQDLGDVPRP